MPSKPMRSALHGSMLLLIAGWPAPCPRGFLPPPRPPSRPPRCSRRRPRSHPAPPPTPTFTHLITPARPAFARAHLIAVGEKSTAVDCQVPAWRGRPSACLSRSPGPARFGPTLTAVRQLGYLRWDRSVIPSRFGDPVHQVLDELVHFEAPPSWIRYCAACCQETISHSAVN